MSVELQSGRPLEQVFAAQKPPVWDKNKPLMREALQRYDSQHWQQFLTQMADIDKAAKGVLKTCPWRLLEKLCLQAAGVRQA
jgi:DNA polymerase-3 subunit delta